ncbi:hypothetical protein [Cytophaga aurantiaca]|uniref:hypothetical protein n=1 Tax=Cytophaga aurantiaca TaxID=29530 RepID=UPI000364969A|nr:hypothetical protein [Cytophaga aurantiaca]
MELFSVNYQLKISINNNGEFTGEYITRTESMTNTSNYLPEILTDIYEKHRHEWLMGVEIREVNRFYSAELESATFAATV